MKWLYRLGSLCAVCAITLSFLIVPVSAAEAVGTSMSYDWNRGGAHITGTVDVPRYDSLYVAERDSASLTAGTSYFMSMDEFALDVEQMYSGAVGLYISYYYSINAPDAGTWGTQSAFDMEGFYTNDVGDAGTVPTVEWSSFTPNRGGNPSEGFRLSCEFVGYPHLPISSLGIRRTSSAGQAYFTPSENMSGKTWYLYIPSVSVVGVASSEELSALEGVADSIAAQNEILNAMYGDIVSICNSIYQRTGDLVAAQDLTNQYFAQLIPILNIIQSDVGSISSNTANIYTLLASQFANLITTIQSESFDIQEVIKGESAALQDAIDSAADKIITYFETLYDYGGQDVIDHDSAKSDISSAQQTENDIGKSLVESFYQLPAVDFSGSINDGISSILNLFAAIWNALAPLHPYFYFSWLLGICLVIIGRKGRVDD